MNNNEIVALFEQWNDALQTKIPKNVVALYDTDAVLLPTISNKVCNNHQEIEEYFINFLAMDPLGKIDESHIKVFDDLAMHSGVYTFSLKGDTKVQARFTFMYRWNGEKWLIIKHHSSQMPESTPI